MVVVRRRNVRKRKQLMPQDEFFIDTCVMPFYCATSIILRLIILLSFFPLLMMLLADR